MTSGRSDRWPEIDALFQTALDRPPGERRDFVRDACGDDGELLEAVTELLDAVDDSGDLLEPAGPALAELAADLLDEQGDLEGRRIGAYRVVRRIDRGGMGTVYRVERADGAFTQHMALKVLRRGVDTEDVLRRFLAERQILASLDHPAIARLLDGGETEDGQPYLVMEHVDGRPIDEYCDEQRLTVDERLRLFITVAEAVRHAHGRLVIHRDLKPSNVLVTDDGAVKLLDFGIAKLLDGSDLTVERPRTRTGVHLLTPEYASPEQVRGAPITTASDVYQLGVLLYRLLTGALPHRRGPGSLADLTKAVATERPAPPSETVEATGSDDAVRLHRRLRGDLDTIMLAALRKEPERRYPSAERMIEDIRRHLAGRPISARPDTWRYRARKFVRRNRAGVLGAAAAVILLIAYVATVTIYAGRLGRQRDIARDEAQKAERVSQFMGDVLALGNGAAGNYTLTVSKLLANGAERARRELRNEPVVQAEVLAAIARGYNSLTLHPAAREAAERALALRRRVHGPDHPDVAESLLILAETLAWTPNDSVIPLYEQALATAERVYGPDHAEVARVLMSFAQSTELSNTRSWALSERALTILREADGDNRALLAKALITSTYGSRDLPLAVRRARAMEAITLRREVFGDRHALVGSALSDLALNVQYVDPVAADTLLREAVEIHGEWWGEDHPETLSMMNNRAGLLRDRGRLAEAERMYRQVLRIRQRTYPEDAVHMAYTLYGLGRVLTERGRPREAETLLRRGVDTFPEIDSRSQAIRGVLGTALVKQGRLEEAKPILLDAWSDVREGSSTYARREVLRGLVTLYEATGERGRAAAHREQLEALS